VARLTRILDGYRRALWFDEVRFPVVEAGAARTIAATVHAVAASHERPGLPPSGALLSVAPWPGLSPAQKLAVSQAIERASERPR
jgi:hypothetical protein